MISDVAGLFPGNKWLLLKHQNYWTQMLLNDDKKQVKLGLCSGCTSADDRLRERVLWQGLLCWSRKLSKMNVNGLLGSYANKKTLHPITYCLTLMILNVSTLATVPLTGSRAVNVVRAGFKVSEVSHHISIWSSQRCLNSWYYNRKQISPSDAFGIPSPH